METENKYIDTETAMIIIIVSLIGYFIYTQQLKNNKSELDLNMVTGLITVLLVLYLFYRYYFIHKTEQTKNREVVLNKLLT